MQTPASGMDPRAQRNVANQNFVGKLEESRRMTDCLGPAKDRQGLSEFLCLLPLRLVRIELLAKTAED